MKSFLRNDDVRNKLDDSLRYLTEQTVANGFPVTHAVEPANLSMEVVDWLIAMHSAHPELVEIIQHGCDHEIRTKGKYRGEFGSGRPYDEQLDAIRHGAALMDRFWGDLWTKIFSFPYGTYNNNTLDALEACQFKMISTGVRFTWKRVLFNAAGRLLQVKRFFGRNVVYFSERVPGYSLYEFPVVMNSTKKQISINKGIQYTASELIKEWDRLPKFIKIRGILCHHRFNSREDIDELMRFMIFLRNNGVQFSQIGILNEEMDNMQWT